MSDTVLEIRNLSKLYRLGEVGTGTLSHDLNRWWARIRGKEDPFAKVGRINDRTRRDGVPSDDPRKPGSPSTIAAESPDYVWALKDVDLDVKRGEVLGVIGANGAGKSTLLKLISRITSPTTGHIRAKGRIASLLEVGTGMHPEMTGRENIYLNGAILGMRRREIAEQFDDIVDFSGCGLYVDTPVKRYSSGMRVRLGFAVAAFLRPEILIVDEVLAVGDAEFQSRAIGKMKEVSCDSGRTVLFVSHNMAAVQQLCTSGLLLHPGRPPEIGDTNQTIRDYLRLTAANSPDAIGALTCRKGDGAYRFQEFRVEDNQGRRLDVPRSGECVNLAFRISSIESTPVSRYRLGIAFHTDNGAPLFVCSTETSASFPPLDPSGVVVCRIPRLPLMRGEYTITLFLEVEGVIQDWLEKAFRISVESGDFFGSGKLCPEGWEGNGVLVPHDWLTRKQ